MDIHGSRNYDSRKRKKGEGLWIKGMILAENKKISMYPDRAGEAWSGEIMRLV